MTTLMIPEMSCGHCKAAVEAALSGLPGVAALAVDLAARRVEVTGPADPAAMVAALAIAGYAAETAV